MQPAGARGPLLFALFGCDRKMFVQDDCRDVPSQLEELVAQEVALAQKGPKELPK